MSQGGRTPPNGPSLSLTTPRPVPDRAPRPWPSTSPPSVYAGRFARQDLRPVGLRFGGRLTVGGERSERLDGEGQGADERGVVDEAPRHDRRREGHRPRDGVLD